MSDFSASGNASLIDASKGLVNKRPARSMGATVTTAAAGETQLHDLGFAETGYARPHQFCE
jgi:hypothetical protein